MYYFRGCVSFAARYAPIIVPPIHAIVTNFRGCLLAQKHDIQQQNHASKSARQSAIPSSSQTTTMYQLTQSVHPLRRPVSLITASLSACPAILSFLLLASSSTRVLRFLQLSLASINHQSSSISILSTSLIICFSASTWLPRGCVDTSLHQLPASCNNASSLVRAFDCTDGRTAQESQRVTRRSSARRHYCRIIE